MYTEELKIYGINENLSTTPFTERLVESIPYLQSGTRHGKTWLAFNRNLKNLLSEYVKCPSDFFLSRRSFVSPICKEIAKQSNKFDGSFHRSSKFDSSNRGHCPILSAVLLLFYSLYRTIEKQVKRLLKVRRWHSKNRETTMLIYCRLKIYLTKLSRNIFDSLFHLGFCISYDRVLEITKNIYENLRESYKNNEFFSCKSSKERFIYFYA